MNFLLLLSSAVKFIVLLFHLRNPPSLLHSHPVGVILRIARRSWRWEDLMKSSSRSLCHCRTVASLPLSPLAAVLDHSPNATPTTPAQRLLHRLIGASLRNAITHSFRSFKPRFVQTTQASYFRRWLKPTCRFPPCHDQYRLGSTMLCFIQEVGRKTFSSFRSNP